MSKCRVFAIDDSLKMVVENGLYMKTIIGKTMSVAVVKFVEEKGGEIEAKAHSHGEEASFQVKGSCSFFEVHQDGTEVERKLDRGDALLIPAGLTHYGINAWKDDGMSMRLNVVSPPRAEYGSGDGTPYYPIANRGA
jgi:quercetin dioxygenase-like cupin family protein